MDTVKVKRIAKKAAKNGFWLLSDAFFLCIKAAGTLLLITAVALAVFTCFFLYYIRDNVITDLEINPSDFTISQSSMIYYIDPQTDREVLSVVIQSLEYRSWVDYEEIPRHLINALVAIEDHRFYEHQGVDWFRTAGAFVNMFLGMRNTFGGSTITQQLIKNLTQQDDATVQRKLQEIFRALEYERKYGKEEILELYLNLVYFGHGVYGIGAAAHYYFNKDVSELTLPEAAAIVGITNNPSLYSPYADREANKDRQETILHEMYDYGYIKTATEYRQAVNAVLHFQRGVNDSPEQVVYSWFEEAIMRDVLDAMVSELGYSEEVARRRLYNGGLKIISTMNPGMQAIVDEVYNNPSSLPVVTGRNSSQQLQSGIVIADPYTGEILAMSGGVGRKTRNLLRSRAVTARRPPGSALKPISAYAPALDMGLLTPETTYNDSANAVLTGTDWMPKNANRQYAGVVTVREALRSSINTVAAMVVDQLTPPVSYRFVKDTLGLDLIPEDENYAPLAAGQLTRGATVREMASAFTMFPNHGQRLELRTFSMIYDYNGDVLLDNSVSESFRAINEVSAYWMTDMLYDAVTKGTGGSANLGSHMPTAGKTGSSSDYKDRWFVGFTPYYLAAVWTGFDNPVTMESAGNSNPAAQIWKMIMEPIHADLETREFFRPENVELPSITSPWELENVEYTVRCVDIFGNILFEQTDEAVIDSEVSADAPVIDEYILVSQPFGAVQISIFPERNIILFTYMPEYIFTETPDPGHDYPPDYPDGLPPDTPPDIPPDIPPDPGHDYPPDMTEP